MDHSTFLHFKHKITLEEVEQTAKFYAIERLGLENAIFREDETIVFRQNIISRDLENDDNLFICSFKLPTENVIEHSSFETSNVPFRKGLLDYIGWKLGASYRLDTINDTKQPVCTFLTNPFVCFNDIPNIDDNIFETALYYLLGQTHSYFKEFYDIAPINKLCNVSYPYDEHARFSKALKENANLNRKMEAIANKIRKSPYSVDYLYGDAIRCAIIHSNLKIVQLLLEHNFLLVDHLDLSLIPHPPYISKQYLKEISLPILCLTVQCLASDSFSSDYANVIKMMIRRGANPYTQDYLGRDSLDYLLNTSHLQKRHKTIIFNEIAKYFSEDDVINRIHTSPMTDMQKSFYLSKVTEVEFEINNKFKNYQPISHKNQTFVDDRQMSLF